MVEIELKFQVPPLARPGVQAEVARLGAAPTRLQAVYFDTVGRDLARAGMALRMRQEGPHWVQTLKGLGANPMERLEDNRPRVGAEGGTPEVDPQCHADSAVGRHLLQILSAPAAGPLQPTYRTDILRRHAEMRTRRGRVELALDIGRIVAGTQRLEVHELEFELVEGRPWAVLGAARAWVRRYGLWLDLRSKAQMGERLARGITAPPAARASTLARPAAADPQGDARVAFQAALNHALANASDIAGGLGSPEHVRQWGLAMRSLQALTREQALGADLIRASSSGDLPTLLRAPHTTLLWLDALACSQMD